MASASEKDIKQPVYGPRDDATAPAAASEPPRPPPPLSPPAGDLRGRVHERPGEGGGSPSPAAAGEAEVAKAAATDRKDKKVAATSSSPSTTPSSSEGSNSPPIPPFPSFAGSMYPSASPIVPGSEGEESSISRAEKRQVKPSTPVPEKKQSLWRKIKSGVRNMVQYEHAVAPEPGAQLSLLPCPNPTTLFSSLHRPHLFVKSNAGKDTFTMALLSEPVTSKHTKRGGNNRFMYAVSTMQGYSLSMEDSYTAIEELEDCSRTSFFGVYDGHAGASVASFCSENLHRELQFQREYYDDLESALKGAFLSIDFKLMKQAGENEFCNNGGEHLKGLVSCFLPSLKRPTHNKHLSEGCTACAAVIRNDQVIVGNVGDLRCAISRNGQAIVVSTDHKPDHPSESKRIKDAGHTITVHAERGNIPLVGGRLAVSRTIGDLMYKANNNLTLENQAVTSLPDTCSITITDETEFLVIASGIWDCMSAQEVVDCISRGLCECSRREPDLGGICESVLDNCVGHSKSKKNMSLVLVRFKRALTSPLVLGG